MKRHIISAILLGSLVFAAPAFAQSNSDTETVQIGGNVAPLCVLGAPSATLIDLGQLVNLSGNRVGKLAALGDRSVTMPGSFCNYANSKLTVDASALVAVDTSAPQNGFARAVNYTATAGGWASANALATTAAAAGGASPSASASGGTQATPKLNDVTLTLSGYSVPSDLLLVAGGYSGQVVITLGPAAVVN